MTARLCNFVLVSVLVVVGCTKKEENLELKVHIPKVNINLDPHRMEDLFSMMILSQLYRGLLRFSPTGEVKSDLAESWTEAPDHLKYRFKIKEEAKFSDGRKITAKNVQMSFARLFALEASMASDIDYIKGASEFIKTKDISKLGIRAVSASEVEFELSHPSALFLKHIAVVDCAILPIESFKQPLVSNPEGTFSGPYRLTKANQGNYLLQKWRKDSFESASPPETILFFESDESPLELARAGKTDTLDRDPIEAEKAKQFLDKGWGNTPTELTGETFVILNPRVIPDSVRNYLFQKVNQKTLLDSLKESHFSAAYGVIPTGFAGELDSSDVEGIKDSAFEYRGKKVTFKLDFEPGSQVQSNIAEYLKKVWSHQDIEVVLNPLKKKEKLSRMFSKEAEATIGQKSVDYPDGYSVLTYFKGKYDANYFHVNDPDIDGALSKVLLDFDPLSRAKAYKTIQLKILTHHTLIPLLFGSLGSGLWSPRLASVPPHPMGYHTLGFETLEMKKQ